jgi:CheY-like chemotaxis protein/anti-sigma regulatory factor (Ser/Thr protein kinase)
LLDISRLEAGGLLAEPHPFPLTSVLEPLAREFSILAGAKGLRLHVVPTRIWVNTDPQLLRRILQNFLANAVRYSTQGGVLIGARRVQGAIRVDVVDSGPGIASEHIHAIFEEFHRGRTGGEPGLGLGLTIADRLSSLLNTPLGLRSEPGRGSTFSVTVPRCQPLQPMSISVRKPLDDNIAGKCVMVVDNVADVLGAVRSTLQSWGCVVAAFHDHHAAGFDAAAAKAQAWILDYHLDHDETGVSLWRRLVRLHGQRPTIIITGNATPAVQQSVRNAGLDLLNKPFKPLALRWAINHLLSTGSDGRQRSASTASTESAAQDNS